MLDMKSTKGIIPKIEFFVTKISWLIVKFFGYVNKYFEPKITYYCAKVCPESLKLEAIN